ncbi:AhpC/TSA family protein [Blastopirellula sp. JC732]|uniref:thioredoxin-dependent peroxiredoxin n=1 Tax=Blastopirellula sediminis TaxID=2894196 RepID=A0A9X1MM84_9BACT|nr:peroxiredoxin-like family protein [Blastopirellula sediminis]MCC9607019.1 AhpC/TSA family protein [Blastopirellula sediminis]MCC9629688.1 AhpC/TSA family protein [Blastopirellula sediminis]
MSARNSLEIGDAAPHVTVQTCQGEPVQLADRWRDQPLLIQFARHLGCPFCRDRAQQLKLDYAEIAKHRGDVVFITMGPHERAQQLKESMQLPFDVLVDPHRSAYQAFRVPRGGFSEIAGPRVWLPGLSAVLRSGIGTPGDDLVQLQGTFVVDETGVIRLVHTPRHSADFPQLSEVLAALDSQTAAS